MEVQSCSTVKIAETPEAPTTGIEQLMGMMQMFIPMMLMLVMLGMVVNLGDILGGEWYE
jgi:hypothetical protein